MIKKDIDIFLQHICMYTHSNRSICTLKNAHEYPCVPTQKHTKMKMHDYHTYTCSNKIFELFEICVFKILSFLNRGLIHEHIRTQNFFYQEHFSF